ncbi:MAG: SGNH/GDSL hydrolase family protein [Bradyrhizobium sp.]
MKSYSGPILGLIVLAGLLTAGPARAEDAPESCAVPDYLLATESTLSKVADAVKNGRSLDILVVGSRSSTIDSTMNNSEAGAYPGRLLVALKEKLPSIAVNVSVDIQAKKTAEEVAAGLPKLMEGKKSNLVIWQTGTVDAVRSVDPEDFRAAVDDGVVALQEAGADVILMNPQYSPRTETMISVPPYLDNMRVVAQQHDVPLFDRFAIMRHWAESGEFDLFSTFHGVELAKRVHDCIGRALSQFVIDAAHLGPAQQN